MPGSSRQQLVLFSHQPKMDIGVFHMVIKKQIIYETNMLLEMISMEAAQKMNELNRVKSAKRKF